MIGKQNKEEVEGEEDQQRGRGTEKGKYITYICVNRNKTQN